MSDDGKPIEGDDKPELTLLEGGRDGDSERPRQAKRKLTSKQERFLSGLIRGMSQYDAYCAAYNAENMKRSSIDNEAWRHDWSPRDMLGDFMPIMRLLREAASTSALSRRRLVLERLEHEAVNAESDSARVRALELLGKTHDVGLFVERIETDSSDRSPDELRRELQDKLTALLTG
jgi:hypothetical protein